MVTSRWDLSRGNRSIHFPEQARLSERGKWRNPPSRIFPCIIGDSAAKNVEARHLVQVTSNSISQAGWEEITGHTYKFVVTQQNDRHGQYREKTGIRSIGSIRIFFGKTRNAINMLSFVGAKHELIAGVNRLNFHSDGCGVLSNCEIELCFQNRQKFLQLPIFK